MKPLFYSPTGAATLGPVPGSEFHNDRHDHLHNGVDLNCQRIPLIAGTHAVITFTGRSTGLGGNKVEMRTVRGNDVHVLKHYHFGYKNQPWQDCILVRPGQQVWVGQPLGIAGDSGNASAVHDHYEHWLNGKPIDPLQHLREYQVIRRWFARYALAYPKAEGPDIPHMQQRLCAHGYQIAQDGVYGPLTVQAMRSFQATRGLVPDGIVGRKTWQALLRRPML